MARKLYKIKGDMDENRATFFSLSKIWCLPAPSSIKPEERKFVVDSGASMHMLSRTDLNSAELETVRVSKKPHDGFLQPNGVVQTNEEATVYVKDVTILEPNANSKKIYTDNSLEFGKFC